MFGAAIRIAAGWAGAMVVSSIVAQVLTNHILPRLSQPSLLYRSFDGTATWMPVIVTIAAALALIARGLTERGVV